MSRKNILFLLALIFFTGLSFSLHTEAAAKTQTGSCGKEAVWKYNDKTKVLKITGKGALTKRIKLGKEAKEIIVGEGITAISSSVVFERLWCGNGVERLVLPNSLKKISVRAFKGVSFAHDTITLPANVKKIEPGAFWGADLAKIKVSGKNKHFVSKDGVLFSKDYKTLVCYPKGKKTKNYKLPKTVTEIKPMAFAENYYIQKVQLPKNLRKLGGGAFYLCGRLSDINLTSKSKITEITDYDGRKTDVRRVPTEFDSFDDFVGFLDMRPEADEPMYYHFGTFEGTALKSIVIPDGVKYLPSKTFGTLTLDWEDTPTGCPLQEITLGKNFIGEINTGDGLYSEDSLYLYHSWVKSVKVSKGNSKYVVKDNVLYSRDGKTLYQVFSGIKKQSLTIDSKVKRIANGAFFGIEGIKEVIVKGGIESIGFLAFADSFLESFTAEGEIQKIGPGAFTCSKIRKFDCKKDVCFIDKNAFASCFQLETAQLGSNLSYLGADAFHYCVKLKELTLAGSLKEIFDRTFLECESLTKITFPENVSYSLDAFQGCVLLSEIVKTPVT